MTATTDKKTETYAIEEHPWTPFVPENAKVLMLGTFPPGQHRWSMDFYYPNATNDFWRIIGTIFAGDPYALYRPDKKSFDLDHIIEILNKYGIALSDTVLRAHRTRGTASDKDLEVVEPRDIVALSDSIPTLRAIATTGHKAAEIVAAQTSTAIPPIGQAVKWRDIDIYRMPSSSRAYPLSLSAKADRYRTLFHSLTLI